MIIVSFLDTKSQLSLVCTCKGLYSYHNQNEKFAVLCYPPIEMLLNSVYIKALECHMGQTGAIHIKITLILTSADV